jgi:amidase
MGAVELAGHRLDELGHMVEPAALDLPADVAWAFGKVVNSALAGYPGVDWSMTERHVRAAREAAETVDSVDYVRSVQDLQLYTRVVAARFDTEFDILVTPTMSIKPPRAGEVLAAAHAGSGMPAEVLQMSAFTSIFNVTGLPAISLPLYQSASGLPVGVQLVAGPWEEARLLQVAAQLEAAEPWSQRRPPADLLEAHAGGLELP